MPAGAYDAFIQKLNTSGTFIWAKQITGLSHVRATEASLSAVGEVAITGNFFGTVDFDPSATVYNLRAMVMLMVLL